MVPEGIKFREDTDWDDVFRAWQLREGTRADWQGVAKEKGWKSWDEWRIAWIDGFGARGRTWSRYEIAEPLKNVPLFRVGPTRSWQKNFPENEWNTHTFADLVERVSLENHSKIRSLLEDFPQGTEFIGVCLADGQVVDIEGHHRAAALAIAAKQGRKMVFKKNPTIALTFFEKGEEKLLDEMLARGSTFKPAV